MKTKIKLIDIKPTKKNTHWSQKQLNMIESISNHYDENMSLISVAKHNEIIDGHHRYKILSDKFGDNYEITVRKFNVSIKVCNTIILLQSLLILLLSSPFYLLLGIFNVFSWTLKELKKLLDKSKQMS